MIVVDKRMLWTACSIMYHGLLRSSEILSRKSDQFDPDYTMLDKNMKLLETSKGTVLQLEIKAPKESKKNATVIVDIGIPFWFLTLWQQIHAFHLYQQRHNLVFRIPLFSFALIYLFHLQLDNRQVLN